MSKCEQSIVRQLTSLNKEELVREDIANIIRTETESAIRLLSEFKKEGVIALKGKNISLKNIPELKKIAQGF
jgi:CRP-like cAMP-binding protein